MKHLLFYIFICFPQLIIGQTYILESADIAFFSEAPLENIEAKTQTAKGIFKAEDGQIAFQIPINTFQFRKSLMREHFNENYMESEKYPNATFSGKIVPFNNTQGKTQAKAVGKLTIHGVTNDVSVDGTLEQKDGNIIMKAKFPVRLQDYDIDIPRVVFYNIAEVVDVNVDFQFKAKISQ